MPEINGISFLRSLKIKPMVIFITAYPQYALESYDLDAIDYLVKPVRPERLLKAVEKATRYLKMLQNENMQNAIEGIEPDFIFIRADRKTFKIYFREIIYIEALKDYVILHTETKKIITAMNIKSMMAKLPSAPFVRISRSYIVNMVHIIAFDAYTVFVRNEELPIGSTYKEEFITLYTNKKNNQHQEN